MEIYIINLARAPERLAQRQAEFDAFGLPFETLVATDGRALTPEDKARVDHKKRRKISPYPLTDNEIGCWLSHCRAMQRVIDRNLPMAAILEDDATLSADFPRVIRAIESHPAPFDVIDLHRNFKKSEIFSPARPLTNDIALGRIGYTHMNATGYVISNHGAKKFLAATPTFAHAVDKDLHSYWINGLDIYGLEKPVAVQNDGGHSYIDETRGQDRPQDRPRYPDSNSLYWRAQRRWTKIKDSLQKRQAFHTLCRKDYSQCHIK